MKGVPEDIGGQFSNIVSNQVKFDNQKDVSDFNRHMGDFNDAIKGIGGDSEQTIGVMKTISNAFNFFSDPNWRKNPYLVGKLKEGERLLRLDEKREETMKLLRGLDQMQKDDL